MSITANVEEGGSHPFEVEHDVAMRGGGFYTSNSDLQRANVLKALPLFSLRGARQPVSPSRPFTIVDYGSSSGVNSIDPFSHICKTYFPPPDPSTPNTKKQEVTLVFSDRPSNDFNNVSETIQEARPLLTKQHQHLSIFPTMIPCSFYDRVMPTSSVDIAFSCSCLHYLSRLPHISSPEVRQETYRQQAHGDLKNFFLLRAQELVPGAPLVLSFVCSASSKRPNYGPATAALQQGLQEMLHDGRISPKALELFEIPFYSRTIQDVRSVLEEPDIAGKWKVDELFEHESTHPAYQRLVVDGYGGEDDIAYARVVIEWFLAVLTNYFLTALRMAAKASGTEISTAEENSLLVEWRERCMKIYLEHHRNERLFATEIYVRLVRTEER
ncbi:MAG: hypothetical protein M1834_009713 [Cirrosporium novae-zelandiae]|nr:MAG: hypothetical protein M1834_009713 [Cirrosporium novae-zelandiae]